MDDTASRTIRIRLLGPVEVAADGAPGGGTKQRLVLTLLALRTGEVVPTDTLVELLWPHDRPADPERSLQVHVSNLRQTLQGAGVDASIEHRGHGYVLRVDPAVVDARRFEELVEAGVELAPDEPDRARPVLEEALGLWGGEPFGGLADHQTLRGEATRLRELRLRALEARVDADLATGRHQDVVGELGRLTAQHPLREGLWRRLMVALYRCGRQGEALEAYDRARRTLAEELGVDPSPSLRELHGRILQQSPELDGAAAWATTHAEVGLRPPAARSVAVLPFDVFGETDDAAYLALGLHNDLVTELSRIPQLTVISRTSVLGYRGTDKPVPAIARELNTATVVEGTVQSAGRRFRLTVQLIDGHDDGHRWAESYDHELTTENLFAIQSDLARDIAAALSAELAPDRADTSDDGPPTHSLDAYRLVAQGRQQFDLKTEAGFRHAIEFYGESAEIDPAYADAWVGLAASLASMEAYGHGERHDLLARAEQAVHRALALAPDSAQARTSLGVLHTTYQNGPAALGEFERAMRVQPSYADAHNWHSWVSLLTGQGEAGLASALRAVELDPLAPEAHAHVSLGHAAVGAPARGLAAARQARRLSPYTTADLYEGICLVELGRYDDARTVLEPLTMGARGELGVPWAGHGPDAVLALALIGAGDATGARRVLGTIDRDGYPFAAALVHSALGEAEEAADAFDRISVVTAWPSLAFHHYHRDVWRSIAGTAAYRRLVRTAHRSWRLDPPGDA